MMRTKEDPPLETSIAARFMEEFTLAKLRRLRDAILAHYPAAAKHYREHLSNIADRRLLGRMRSAGVEDALLAVAQEDPALYAVSLSNRKRSWGFALVETSEFLFTAVTLRSLKAKPPRAEYRECLGDQLQIFAPRPPSGQPGDVLLVHVPPRRLEDRPAQLQIRFLNGEGQYYPDVIDLLALEVATVVRLPRVRKERVERTARVTIRRQKRDNATGEDR